MFGSDRIAKLAKTTADALTTITDAVDARMKIIFERIAATEERFQALNQMYAVLDERVGALEAALASSVVAQAAQPNTPAQKVKYDPTPGKYDGDEWEAAVTKNAGIEIEYSDSKNAKTRRKVTPWRARGYTVNRRRRVRDFYAFCELRGGTRSFFKRNIKDAIDLETGEIIQDIDRWLLDRCIE